MDLRKIFKNPFGTVKSTVKSVSNMSSFKELKDFFTWGFQSKSVSNFLKAYKRNPLVYMVVNKISQTTAAMPRIVIDFKGDEVADSKLKRLIENPNSNQSQIEFNEEINESLLLTGNVYILFTTDSDLELIDDSIYVLKPDRTKPKFDKFGNLVSWDYVDEFGKEKNYPTEDILHIKTPNIVEESNTYYTSGLSPLEAGWIIIESSDQKLEAEASIFKNRGIIGVLTTDSDTPMLPDERQRMQDEYDEEMGGASKFNKLKISTTKLRYLQTGMTPTDLKLLEGIISSLRLICGLFGMPSVLFNDTANSSFNNYTTAVSVSYSDVYVPLANKIDDKLSRFLSGKYSVIEHIKVDSSKVDGIKTPTNEIAQALTDLPQLLGTSIVGDMTQNERRSIVGLESKEGGDVITPINPQPVNVNV